MDYFYTGQQATKLLKVNRITIWRWVNNGKLSSQRIGQGKRGILLIPKWEIDLLKEQKERKHNGR